MPSRGVVAGECCTELDCCCGCGCDGGYDGGLRVFDENLEVKGDRGEFGDDE